MIVYRISDCKYIKDLTGNGAFLYDGRWHNKGTYIVYTAESRALALLENVVHRAMVKAVSLCMATIDIPDNSIESFPAEKLPVGWHTNPSPNYLKAIGDHFIKNSKHLALKIPSALMMEEHNYLLNPAHPAFGKVQITAVRSIGIDERLFPAS